MKPQRNLTDKQIDIAINELTRLIKCAGGVSSLANDVGVTRQNVYDWIKKGRISATGAAVAAEIKKYSDNGFTRESLCPDITEWYI